MNDTKMENKPEKDHRLGHRQRLRERFLKDLGESMPDYELLELLLCLAIPRGDVKPLAKRLLAHFGDYAGVISADQGYLRTIDGVGEGVISAIKLANVSALRLLRQRINNEEHIINSWDRLLDYIQAAMSREKIELVKLLFLDNRFRIISDENHQRGTINHTPLYPREIIKRVIELGAQGLVMVHNHPSGNPKPSNADIEMTMLLKSTLKGIDVKLHDHIIVGRNIYYSFKSKGLI